MDASIAPDLEEVLAAMGEAAVVVNPPAEGDAYSGGDFDCVVKGLDLLWPLSAPGGVRALNVVQYDLRGWTWHVEVGGRVLVVDTLDDPEGIGRFAFKTSEGMFDAGRVAPPPLRAAYLTLKRLYKREADPKKWREVADLARTDPSRFVIALAESLGHGMAQSAEVWVRTNTQPSPEWCRKARRRMRAKRAATPGRLARIASLGVARAWSRLTEPAGLYVLFVGPDGSGKSSTAGVAGDALSPIFRRVSKTHWRPGILPRLGRLKGTSEPDASRPHARPPYGRLTSTALLLYYWADFVIGDLVLVRAGVVRGRLVVTERGWWDFEVDPARYRLSVNRRLVRALGAFVRPPDLTIHMAPPAHVAVARKPEISPAEYDRQQAILQKVTARWSGVVRHTGAGSVEDSAGEIVSAARSHLHRRTLARLGPGWVALSGGRFYVPRGPRAAAVAALDLFQPMTARGRLGRTLTRVAGGTGLLHVLPRSDGLPADVRRLLEDAGVTTTHVALSRSNHPGRYTAKLLGRAGHSSGIAKLATDEAGAAALEREGRALRSFGPLLATPLRAPRVLAEHLGVLVVEDLSWRVRTRPWLLPSDVATSLGALYASADPGASGLVHGDFAPWNLLETDSGWALIDWEEATADGLAFFDIFHYMTQAHALLGAVTESDIQGWLDGRGPYSHAIASYATAARLPTDGLQDRYVDYLESSLAGLSPGVPDQEAGIRARERLLGRFGRR